MAHHASTPQSVLSVQGWLPTTVWVVQHRGITRQERRHGVVGGKPLDWMIYRATKNVPHIRTTPRRGRKVVRGGLA